MIHHRRRLGINAVETILLLTIVVVGVGVLLSALVRTREKSEVAQCLGHLRSIGTAMHAYAEIEKCFPPDDDSYDAFALAEAKPNFTFYGSLLPYLKEKDAFRLTAEPPGPNASLRDKKLPALREFFCPSRRTPEVGPRDDYAAPHHVAWFEMPPMGEKPQAWYSILGAIGPKEPGQGLKGQPDEAECETLKPVTLELLKKHDGLSNTILLAHKGVATNQYNGTGPNDQGYPYLGSFWEHKRYPFRLAVDFECDQEGRPASDLLTSPHPGSMPMLFADASVRSFRYDADPMFLARLFSWNDGSKESEAKPPAGPGK